MKKLLIFVLLIAFAQAVPALGLRHSVCAVKPMYTAEEKQSLCDYALWLSRNDRAAESRWLLAAVCKDWYGSGCVILHNDSLCVLTQRYVLGYASQAEVTFYLHDRTIRISGCRVLVSDSSELAMLSLPRNEYILPLPFAHAMYEDGDKVVAAGYPCLQGVPEWQMAHGNISNAWLELNGHTYIRNTASADFGSTGGPLLVRTDQGYELLGINATRQENAPELIIATTEDDCRQFLSAPLSKPVLPTVPVDKKATKKSSKKSSKSSSGKQKKPSAK